MVTLRPLALLLVGLLSSAPIFAAAGPAPTVVLISVDGLPADYFDNPQVDMPTLRMMAKGGAHAERMTAVLPTVTWPNHASLVTGVTPARHGVLGNFYFDRTTRQEVELLHDPVFDKEQIVKVPTVYDAAHLAGLKTAGIAWPASRNAQHLDWQVPFVTDTALFARYSTPSLLAYLKSLGIGPEKNAEWSKVEVGGRALWDWMNTQLAKHVLLTHRPNLLLLHLDAIDSMEHRMGRNSPEAYWACHEADGYLREMIEAVQAAGLAEHTTFFVVSDHGFQNYTKMVHLGSVLRDAGLVKSTGKDTSADSVYFLSASGSGGIYILDEPNRATITRDLVAKLKTVEGVAAVITGDEILAQGMPLGSTDPRAPDIILSAAPGYAFGKNPAMMNLITPVGSTKGAHGHLPLQPDLYATFVAWGAAIKPGVTMPQIRNLDVAPTIATVLGVKLPAAEGRVLSEILR